MAKTTAQQSGDIAPDKPVTKKVVKDQPAFSEEKINEQLEKLEEKDASPEVPPEGIIEVGQASVSGTMEIAHVPDTQYQPVRHPQAVATPVSKVKHLINPDGSKREPKK